MQEIEPVVQRKARRRHQGSMQPRCSGPLIAKVSIADSGHHGSFWEGGWVDSLTSGSPRPNLLVSCHGIGVEPILARLVARCRPPCERYQPRGRLHLPAHRLETLLICDVAALTLRQQIDLYDWIVARSRETQVISITSSPLVELVENGRFLEGLFHRLSVVHLLASREHAGALR